MTSLRNSILGFHVTSRHHKIPADATFFSLQKWTELGHVSQVANVWLSSHNFGEVAVIQKFQYFQKLLKSFGNLSFRGDKMSFVLDLPVQ